jgi:hypothetical protein
MGDRNEQPDDSVMHILNDLARGQNELVRVQNDMVRGQQQMVELLIQLVNNNQGSPNNPSNYGPGRTNGSHGNNGNHAEGSNTHTSTRYNIGAYSRVTPRPHMPQFLEGQQAGNQRQQG